MGTAGRGGKRGAFAGAGDGPPSGTENLVPIRTEPHMPPSTDYVRHAARLARKIHMEAALGGAPQPDAEFYKTLAKALEEIADGMQQVGKRE